MTPVPEETQLRAKRTRIKILRALANHNGTAGFSDIKSLTGLSTGSIYYHLERMDNYVTKSERHSYKITEEGRELLRQIDSSRNTNSNGQKKNDNNQNSHGRANSGEETLGRKREPMSGGGYLYVLAAVAGIALVLSLLAGSAVPVLSGHIDGSMGILLFTAAGGSYLSLHCMVAGPAVYSKLVHS